MEIIVGKYSGFCNGVKHTVNKAQEELKKSSLYSIGEIVHNEEVINDLKKRGLVVCENIKSIPDNSKVLIRAHGEGIEVYKEAKRKNIELVDLTCGRVKLVHQKILSKQDSFIIIIGKKDHPETIAHKSYSNSSYVIENNSDIMDAYTNYLASGKNRVYIVAQTTFNNLLFDSLVEEIKKVFSKIDIMVDKTICNATSIRQEETKEIASKVDKMIIIGGKNSSNTKELEVVAKKYCKEVYLIQTKDNLNKDMFSPDDVVGITAGASTPDNVISDVVNYLNAIYNKKK